MICSRTVTMDAEPYSYWAPDFVKDLEEIPETHPGLHLVSRRIITESGEDYFIGSVDGLQCTHHVEDKGRNSCPAKAFLSFFVRFLCRVCLWSGLSFGAGRFDTRLIEEPPCMCTWLMLNRTSWVKGPFVGAVWKFRHRSPGLYVSFSSHRGSKFRGPKKNSPCIVSKLIVT
ncbi:hypothetical protein AVEN_129943-1 [Araneus ventricosus]|uniref:Uncharacterized protein n=1 Tax=Araneus ventricosus TaxID=182803 RepID=A0A4Y2IB08_ARAVE|nr:hypothetical protein AVEN_129943-1 [Araneus ventricosus]